MMEFVQDVLHYGFAVLTSWKVLVGTVFGWLFFSVVLRLRPFKTRTVLLWLGLFLIIAPFPKWREQKRQIAQLQRAQKTTEAERDSLGAALHAIKTAPPVQNEQSDKYSGVRARLALFVRQADSLVGRFTNDPGMSSGSEVQAWTDRVRHYLKTSAPDPSYEVEFNSAADPGDENAYAGPAPLALTKRRAVLVRFLQQLRRTS